METPSSGLYAICPMDDIAVGKAKAFDLARFEDDGKARPFRIVIIRKEPFHYLGYANSCPHEGVWLNIGTGSFFDSAGGYLQCGKHGAQFDLETGLCVAGPCEGKRLEPVAVTAVSGDICISGIRLLEDDGRGNVELEDTMEVMIHPD